MKRNNKKNLIPLLHLLTWAVLIGLPYLLSVGQDQEQIFNRTLIHSWIPLCFYAIIFYINYLYLIDRFFFNNKILPFILINIGVVAFFVFTNHELKGFLMDQLLPDRTNVKGPPRNLFFYVDMIASMVPIVFSVALKTTERWYKSENERKEAQTIKLQAEIQHLKYQLQPHFFFNSLNNIYALVDSSPTTAKKTIHSLGKLMRYLLYDTETEKVALQKEIDFMTQYIELMKLRFSNKITISYSFPTVPPNIKVVPLLFITLVENAFKHGIPASSEASLSFKMEVTDTFLVFTAKNQNLPKSDSDKSGSGIGLENLRKRLQLLYPDSHSFVYQVKDEIFTAVLTLEI
tara:strand:- start:3152 stop:4189 length:1038 start_codon:yes stop_codon:yes gene_type:complete